MRDKLDPKVERQRQMHAFTVWRDLGYGRTYRAVARIVECSPTTVSKWHSVYKWDERLASHNMAVAKRAKEETALMDGGGSPIAIKLVEAMDRIEALIGSAFIRESSGAITAKIKVTEVDQLSRLISEYRKFLETYHRFVADQLPAKKEQSRNTLIKEFNVNLTNLPQQERIDLMKEIANGDATGGDRTVAGGVSEGDYTEVPGQGDEDRP